MNVKACMGGWCSIREACSNYHAENREDPQERMCLPGQDGMREGYPIRIHRPAGTWGLAPDAAAHVRPASPFPEAA